MKRHPDKEVDAAVKAMRRAGWRIERNKTRAAHAWGKAFCPSEGQQAHWECAVSISGTPRSGANEARRLRHRIKRCLRISEAT